MEQGIGEIMQESNDDARHKDVALALADALRRAMRVAGRDDEGNLRNLKQGELAERAGVSRSKLGKVISPKDDDIGKVDLRTICALADALGVPPAFLLLRKGDWQSIGNAVRLFETHSGKDSIVAWRERFANPRNTGTASTALAAKDLAILQELLSEVPSDLPAQAKAMMHERHEEMEASIVNTAALAPLDALYDTYFSELITLCVFAGVTARSPSRSA